MIGYPGPECEAIFEISKTNQPWLIISLHAIFDSDFHKISYLLNLSNHDLLLCCTIILIAHLLQEEHRILWQYHTANLY